MTTVLIALLRRTGGEALVQAVLARAGNTRELEYLENRDNWVSLDEACALLAAGGEETGNPAFARLVGEVTARERAGTQVATLLRSLGSVEAVFGAITQAATKLSTVTEMEALEARPGQVLVSARARPGYARRALHCEWTTGLLAGTPALFGLPAAAIEELECQARGAERCLYKVNWEAELAAAAADPQQRVTALEAQLNAMNERLQSVYATAGELVSADDVDTALQRIVDRAANAVRAPGYVLAVRASSAAELQVYSHGVDPEEARALAERVSSEDSGEIPGALVADVTSSRSRYGRLVARYPDAGQFFPQEQEMLDLYATHAAAVLDIATALEEAARRNAQISSLLSLAHAAAQAGTSEEIGRRLAAAVPQVVDCDRTSVWRWEEEGRCIRPLAAWGHTAEQEARLRGLTVSTSDTALLESLLEQPRPMFFEHGTNDQFIQQMLVSFEMAAMVIVPIVAFDVFLGVITVVVADRPERLRPDGQLLDRLTGVAALAAPAIQNGVLVDELHHQATHDGLTGLLNRVGFRQRMDGLLAGERRADRKVGLLYVDLNGFKEVNDVYGHDAGDELLRQVALRLREVTRDSDEVARLGGDEFAVVLTHVDDASGTLAAERRVRAVFEEPFELEGIKLPMSASVGGGVWPRDGESAEDVVRHADGAMYRDKMTRRGAPPEGGTVLLAPVEHQR